MQLLSLGSACVTNDGGELLQVFFGFVPSRRGAARTRKLAEVAAEPKACVLYEAPHRILDTLRELIDAAGEVGTRFERA